MNCHCGSGSSYQDCCGRFLSGEQWPETAEALMRARYSAYVEGEDGFLIDSWHPLSCPSQFESNLNQQWLGLKILAVNQGRPGDGSGSVEFVAIFKVSGKVETLHEVSEFVREQGRWCYLSGIFKQ
ncbi:MAG: hypothetical protein H8D52_01605 [Gammaproteobacteria bacterium]|nr:hypothetical protein [Gammaproteobacteria bacterium]